MAMLRLVMQLTNVVVQAATQAGKHQPKVDVPQDAEPRGAEIGGRIGQVPVDLGEPGPDDLIAEREDWRR